MPHAKHRSRYDPPANHLSITANLVVDEIVDPELFMALVEFKSTK
jgi:hypothetical protein